MVHEEEVLHSKDSVKSDCTSASSDSYSYLLFDIENPNNHINEEWEAIERTLYQESGKQVTDPGLLRECKLWRETFPHIRVRGTAIKDDSVEDSLTKSVQTNGKTELELSKLSEKREKIKKDVVSKIVERLINKLNSNKDDSGNESKETKDPENGNKSLNTKFSESNIEKESYFERGKIVTTKSTSNIRNKDEDLLPQKSGKKSERLISSSLLDGFECDLINDSSKIKNENLWSGTVFKSKDEEFSSNFAKNMEILKSGNIKFKVSEKGSSRRGKTEKSVDLLSNNVKPFEMTKRIDMKYESILERILGNRGLNTSMNDNKSNLKSEVKLNESQEKLYRGFAHQEFNITKNKPFPRLNKLSNNWLARADQNMYGVRESTGKNFRTSFGTDSNFNSFGKEFRNNSGRSLQYGQILEELTKEIYEYSNRSRRTYEEEINLQRPQLHSKNKKNYAAITQKSCSCDDLPKNGTIKNGRRKTKCISGKGKSETAHRTIDRMIGNQNSQLPPIETSIICTEIIGRPKQVTRTYPKKY